MYVLVVCLVSTSLASRSTGIGLQIYVCTYVYQASHCAWAIKLMHNIVFQVIWYVQYLSQGGNTTIHLHAWKWSATYLYVHKLWKKFCAFTIIGWWWSHVKIFTLYLMSIFLVTFKSHKILIKYVIMLSMYTLSIMVFARRYHYRDNESILHSSNMYSRYLHKLKV